MSETLDVAIVGGGPAGLSSAATLARQVHSVVVFDSGKYRNAVARHMHTVPGWDHRDPKDFRAQARRDLERYKDVRVVDAAVENAKEDGLFELTDAQGKVWRVRKVVLAVGVEDVFPDIEGYKELWGTGIFHCLFCHGFEESGAASAGVLAVDIDEGTGAAPGPMSMARAPMALHVARMVTPLARACTIYSHGNDALADELAATAPGPPFTVERRRIARLVGLPAPEGSESAAEHGVGGVRIEFADGSAPREERFLASHPKTLIQGMLAQQLGVEMTPTGDVKTETPFPKTSVPGVYAAGDCAGPFKAVPQAIYAGWGAGASASMQVTAERLGQKPLV